MVSRNGMFGLAAALAVAPLCGLSAQSSPMAQARQITHSYNIDLVPSPDGRRAAFLRRIEGRWQIFLVNLDGTGEVQVTNDDVDHEDPAWSPAGDKLLFVANTGDSRIAYLMNPDGSGREQVTPSDVGAIHPSFTPDGRQVLYSTDDDLRPPEKNASVIYSVDLATKRVTPLISGGVNTYPVMSPDGRTIAFRKIIGDMNSEVFVADADGSNLRNLTNHWSYEGWPAWSPDGRRIAFAGNRNSAYQIFIMNADGSDVRLLANTEGRGTAPKWSADGRSVYFTVCQHRDFGRACEIVMANPTPFP